MQTTPATDAPKPGLRHDSGPLPRAGAPALYAYSTFPEGAPKAVVALVHGYFEYGGRYAHVADAWAERGLATVAVDMRGHGRAQGPRGVCDRFGDYVDDVATLAAHVATRAPGLPAFIFGHSFGGLVATSSVLRDKSNWRGLLLSAPYFGLAMKVPAAKKVAGQIASRLVPWFSLPSGLGGADVTHDAERAKAYDADPLNFTKATARWFTEALAAQPAVLERAPSLNLPLYLVMGTEDRVADLATARRVFDAVGSKEKTLDVREGFYHESLNEIGWRSVADAMADWMIARA